jgi:hypothetical protein
MTPLAYRILKDMTLPVRKRTFQDAHDLLKHFREEFHCFEVTQIMEPLVKGLLLEMLDAEFPTVEFAFLPAPRTWFEYRDNDGGRMGCMLVAIDDGAWARVYIANSATPPSPGSGFCGLFIGEIALADALTTVDPTLRWREKESSIFRNVPVSGAHPGAIAETATWDAPLTTPNSPVARLLWQVYPLLLLINTPRVIGRKTHDPHRGLAREILSKGKALGIFPLQAWTEITLKAETIDASDDEPEPSGLTGTVSLHWTRAHRRRIYGVWTLISDYWSGDGSLGIKQSRYKLVP